jgi:hypothetical protein
MQRLLPIPHSSAALVERTVRHPESDLPQCDRNQLRRAPSRDRELPFPPWKFWRELTPDQSQIRQLDTKSARRHWNFQRNESYWNILFI